MSKSFILNIFVQLSYATLLVAVVGATFAYFTATVTTENDDQKTDSITTQTLASATMTYGNKIKVDDALPGWKGIKELHVEGNGPANAQPITATIKVALSAANFANHVKYTLYKTSSQITELDSKCQSSPNDATKDGKYFVTMTDCDPTEMGLSETVISSTTNANSSVDITVNHDTDEYYYLFVEYENVTSGPQNDEQGQTFTATIDFTAKESV